MTVAARFDPERPPDKLKVNPANGTIEFQRDGQALIPAETTIDYSYFRAEKEKVVRRYAVDPEHINLHPDYALHNADTIFVVDTNTKNGISVACFVCGEPQIDGADMKTGIRFRSRYFLVDKSFAEFPERLAWKRVLEREYSILCGRTVLIVDSDLSKIDKFNSREFPIADDYFLPRDVTMIYASADVGREHMLNKIMSKVDKAAANKLNEILGAS